MFDWLKRKKPSKPSSSSADPSAGRVPAPKPAAPSWIVPVSPPANEPKTCVANPGKYLKGKFAFQRGDQNWQEEADVMEALSNALRRGGQSFSARNSWVELEGGFTVMPRMLSFKPLEREGVQTVTTVEIGNPAGIPPAVFEYQHSTGDNAQDSLVKGFESWMQTDLPVFLDALQEEPKSCTCLQIELPAGDDTSAPAKRRVVLGPVAHLVAKPVIQSTKEEEEHPFCPCCLFTKTGDIWKEKMADGQFYGVRLFAMRSPDGESEADCRVNGLDWEAGKRALVQYVNTWPDLGVEFRKQYIIIQTEPL